MFKIISDRFKVKLLTADDAQQFTAKAAEEGEASDSNSGPTSTSQASFDSQCASMRVATAHAVSDGDDFYVLAKSLDYIRGTFMSDKKAENQKKSLLTKGLTEGQLRAKIVKQAEEIAEQKKTLDWCDELYKNCPTCKRAKVEHDRQSEREPESDELDT